MPTPALDPFTCSFPAGPRKRTSSFSVPAPHKAPRTGMSLRRTVSYIYLPEIRLEGEEDIPASSSFLSGFSPRVPYQRTLRHYKDQRDRRKHSLNSNSAEFTVSPQFPVTPKSFLPSRRKMSPSTSGPRASSPLSPSRKSLPPRASFPRSKAEPDLYRCALITRMRCSPEGQKILSMGPRLATSILTATRELEKIVAARMECDCDTPTSDGALGQSWVVVPPDDWEMVDVC